MDLLSYSTHTGMHLVHASDRDLHSVLAPAGAATVSSEVVSTSETVMIGEIDASGRNASVLRRKVRTGCNNLIPFLDKT
jgi:hypothetical protein